MPSWMSVLGDSWIFHVLSHYCLRVGPAWPVAFGNSHFVAVSSGCFSCFLIEWGTKTPVERGSVDSWGLLSGSLGCPRTLEQEMRSALVAPLSNGRGPAGPGTPRGSSQDSWVLFHGTASEEVTVRLVPPAHGCVMTIGNTH